MLSQHSLLILIMTKVLAHWLITGLPLLLLAPILALILHLPPNAMLVLTFSLLIGTPILSLIGAIFAALTVRLRSSTLLLPLLVLPFYIPVLIFGAGSVAIAAQNLSAAGELAVLGAMLALAISLAPLAIRAALRIGE
jgi:heme exporter protein B